MPFFLRKMLRLGKLPEDLREQLESEGIIYLAEYLAVSCRFSGAVPGLRAAGSAVRYAGALVFTSERAVATLPTAADAAGLAVDQRWDASQIGAAGFTVNEAGAILDLDIAKVDPEFHGHLSLHYKDVIPANVLRLMPRTSLAFDVGAQYVYAAVGVRGPKSTRA